MPSKLPDCPSYLCEASSSRENPIDRRERLQYNRLKGSMEESLSVYNKQMEMIFNSLDELTSKSKLDSDWVLMTKDTSVCLLLICEVPYPEYCSLLCSY